MTRDGRRLFACVQPKEVIKSEKFNQKFKMVNQLVDGKEMQCDWDHAEREKERFTAPLHLTVCLK